MIHVIGVGVEGLEGLSGGSVQTLGRAKLVFGSERLLNQLPELPAEKFSLKADLFKMVDIIKKKKKKTDVVVLASGDPNLFGITHYLLRHFSKDDIVITPAVSSMQWAFAMAKETWEDAEIVSAHGRGLDAVIRAVLLKDKVGVFTDDKNSPDKVAGALMTYGITQRKVYVSEDIGTPEARLFEGSLQEAARRKFTGMSVMIIKKEDKEAADTRPPSKALGIPDFQFAHREGMITKSEIRAMALSKLRPESGSVMWDVGAGCGSVAIEAEGLMSGGRVFAVEKDPKQFTYLKKNITKFQASGVEAVEGDAPEALKVLPDPDAVFVGGSSGQLKDILAYVDERLRPGGRVVVNIVTLENLNEVVEFMKAYGYVFEVTSASVSRSKELAGKLFMVGANPVNIVFGVKV